jgi:hypothetical protein
MSKLGDAFSKAGRDPMEEDAPMSASMDDGGEVKAAGAVLRAKTPEAMAKALKNFIEICQGGY